MSGFTGSYLRILTPKTIDGINLMYEADGSIAYKESHLANTRVARELLERQNLKRPQQLKHIIEIVGEYVAKPGPKPNPVINQEQVVKPPVSNINKGKPGPKPKNLETA